MIRATYPKEPTPLKLKIAMRSSISLQERNILLSYTVFLRDTRHSIGTRREKIKKIPRTISRDSIKILFLFSLSSDTRLILLQEREHFVAEYYAAWSIRAFCGHDRYRRESKILPRGMEGQREWRRRSRNIPARD